MLSSDFWRRLARRSFIPSVVLLIGILFTSVVTWYIADQAFDKDRLRFEAAIDETEDTIVSSIDTYIVLLRAASSLFAANTTIGGEQFTNFVERLELRELYPAVQGIGFSVRVDGSQKQVLVDRMRVGGVPEFTITPDTPRDEYHAIIFLEPLDNRNKEALGYDMFSEPVRREAMSRARDTGEPAMSGKVTLVQEIYDDKQPGFLIYLPVYAGGTTPESVAERRQKLLGFVYSPFRVNDLLKTIFADAETPIVDFSIYDGTTISEESALQHFVLAQEGHSYLPNARAEFATTSMVTIAGEPWTIVFSTNNAFVQTSDQHQAPFVFLGGLIVSFALFGLAKFQQRAHIATEKLQQQKNDFIAIASHELKTPITSVKAYTQVLIKRFTKAGDASSTELVQKMDGQLTKLTGLISDLLDVSKIENNKLQLRPQHFDFNQLVSEIVEEMQRTTDRHTMVKRLAEETPVYGDRDRIGQVIINFLSNAIKYSPEGNQIIVSTISAERDKELVLGVQDFGVGVSKENQKKIFERFFQEESDTVDTSKGFGLGLYISAEIIRRHQGRIWVESPVEGSNGTIEQGSKFCFALPLVGTHIIEEPSAEREFAV